MASPGHVLSRGAAVAVFLLPGSVLLANGYNRIREVAIPALVILFALVYSMIALVPAALVHYAVKMSVRGKSPEFIRSYIGSLIGGEIGIALSYAIDKMSGPGWNSYHYTLYPYLILGLSIAGAALYSMIRTKK